MEFIYFLGRFHVLALHLPIGIILVAIAAELLSFKEKYRYLAQAGPFLWAAAALTAWLTVALGLMHFAEGGFASEDGYAHRTYGILFAVAVTLVWLLRANLTFISGKALVQVPVAAVVLFLVTMTGHHGGNLTQGPTYLVEYAPNPIRRLAGLEPRRPPVSDLAAADVYLDVIDPILEDNCTSCHSDSRQRGGLNLADFDVMMEGGESGEVLLPGDATASDLYRRITLASDHEDFMPAEGRAPLTSAEVAILEWWITSGAATNTLMADVEVPAEVRPMLMAELGLGGAEAGETGENQVAGAGQQVEADQQMVNELYQAGFVVRQLSASNPLLSVGVYAPGTVLEGEQLSVLTAYGENIAELNLQSAGVDDADLESLGLSGFTHLERLRLDNNEVTDAGIEALTGLPRLAYLNLYGNQGVTGESIDDFSGMENLKELYLWQTGADEEAIAQLRSRRADMTVQGAVRIMLPEDEDSEAVSLSSTDG